MNDHVSLAQQVLTHPAGTLTISSKDSETEALVRRRFAATGIDLILLCGGLLLFGLIQWSFCVIPVGLFLLRDYGEGYSPGKRLFDLIAFDETNRTCTLGATALRNLCLLPPMLIIELFMLLFTKRGIRLGDMISSTSVERRSSLPASGTADEPRYTLIDVEPNPSESEPEATVCFQSETFDPILETGLLTPQAVSAEELSAAEHSDEATPPPQTAPAPASQVTELTIELAAQCLGLEEVTYDTLDDAYWDYVDRYSPDAAQDLDDEQLAAACAELAAEKQNLALATPQLPPKEADRSEHLQYLNEWFVIVNKCRDTLS